ncbi:PIG-L family deacetylase [Streptomyces sp. SL13]|uniref:PIG-L family deacetylase n=1 Tax=Streptantibioticus silvisoli TaxID=2705255 RepID=A0AA90GZ87_9ACTN|nr:PIG-L family deacetylase [Streptantibioticus silvisoli]MDI5969231.1 PIG-L family deacetylase [Streptantibioticus silvisoli]
MPEDRKLDPMPDDWQRALAIVAHPDDLEYGASAAVAQWTAAGKDVRYVLVTRGEAGIDGLEPHECARIREAEQRASAAAVGVAGVEFLDHHDGVVQACTALRRDLAAAVRRHRPELLITLNHHDTWGGTWWNTPDHRVVGRAVLDAAGDAGNRWIFQDLGTGQDTRAGQETETGQEAETGRETAPGRSLGAWNGVRWTAVAGSPHPTHAVAVTDGFEPAVASLAEHHAYITGLGVRETPAEYARAFLTDTLTAAGQAFGSRLAVAFQVYPR